MAAAGAVHSFCMMSAVSPAMCWRSWHCLKTRLNLANYSCRTQFSHIKSWRARVYFLNKHWNRFQNSQAKGYTDWPTSSCDTTWWLWYVAHADKSVSRRRGRSREKTGDIRLEDIRHTELYLSRSRTDYLVFWLHANKHDSDAMKQLKQQHCGHAQVLKLNW